MIKIYQEHHKRGKHVERVIMRKYRIDKDLTQLQNDIRIRTFWSILVR